MSLKGFHCVFIFASSLLALFFANWGWGEYQNSQSMGHLATAGLSLLAAVGLIIYGILFIKKISAKNVK